MINIFYSWQSDLDNNINQKAIRNAIKNSILEIEYSIENMRINLDEATRGEAGSPDIATTIFQKIRNSDIFICDITTINNDALTRKTPNPNVLVELGYAISILGWERILLVFNNFFGSFSDDLPFDLERRRILNYRMTDRTDTSGNGDLKVKMKDAIKLIIEINPQKNVEISHLSGEQIKRNVDLDSLKNILSTIHFPAFDNFLNRGPNLITENIFHFWENFREIYESSLFYLYNPEIKSLVNDFYLLWHKSLSYGDYFLSHGKYAKFGINHTDKEREVFSELEEVFINLNLMKRELLDYIRKNYLEIDLDETSKSAQIEYENSNS